MRTPIGCGTKEPLGAALARRFAILVAIFFATHLIASAQSVLSRRKAEPHSLPSSKQPHESKNPGFPLPFTPLKPQPLEVPYHPFTPRQSLQWFTKATMDPANLAGGIFDAAFGTAPNRPKEYGPHWGGFADRYGMGVTRSATGNAIEAGVGLILREDPRYFRVPDHPFKARVGNVVRPSP
jgi:hypothetical protein